MARRQRRILGIGDVPHDEAVVVALEDEIPHEREVGVPGLHERTELRPVRDQVHVPRGLTRVREARLQTHAGIGTRWRRRHVEPRRGAGTARSPTHPQRHRAGQQRIRACARKSDPAICFHEKLQRMANVLERERRRITSLWPPTCSACDRSPNPDRHTYPTRTCRHRCPIRHHRQRTARPP